MIKASGLGKVYRKKVAVDDLSFWVETGKVTGFLGPNGSGKSTTMRLMLGLDFGKGTTTFDNKKLSDYEQPSKIVGILLEAKAFHPTRSARNHLKALAAEGGVPESRVNEVLDIVGLKDVAKKGPGKFSLGMSQRLGIAAAILAEPKYLLLDEPANGLDPEGMAWLRQFIRDYAAKGNGVFVSSHLLSEMSQMVDNVVVIGKGKLIISTSVKHLVSDHVASVFVRVNKPAALKKAIQKAGYAFDEVGEGFSIHKVTTADIGKLAYKEKLILHELRQETVSLEEAFLELTQDTQEFTSQGGTNGK